MKKTIIIGLLLLIGLALVYMTKNNNSQRPTKFIPTETAFNRAEWVKKMDHEYPYRPQMLKDLLESDTLRYLKEDEIVALLGKPNKNDNKHLFYRIEEKRLGFFTLHAKTLVIKLPSDSSANKILIHE